MPPHPFRTIIEDTEKLKAALADQDTRQICQLAYAVGFTLIFIHECYLTPDMALLAAEAGVKIPHYRNRAFTMHGFTPEERQAVYRIWHQNPDLRILVPEEICAAFAEEARAPEAENRAAKRPPHTHL